MTAPSLREAAQMAREELEMGNYRSASAILRAALALPDAEPVGYRYKDSESMVRAMPGYKPGHGWSPLYAAPQPAPVERKPITRPQNCGTSFCSCIECVMPVERKPLSTEVIREWWASENGLEDCDMAKLAEFTDVIRAVEEKHHIKGAA